MKINKRHFFIDTFSNGVYFGSKFLGSLVIYSILINSYNLDTYGVYIFFASLLAQLEFMQAGFSTSLLRFLPIYGNNTIKKSNLIAVVSLSYLGIGILVSIALIALSYTQLFAYLAFSGWENYVKILIIVAPIFWFFKSFSFALRGVKDFRFDNLINLFFLVLEILGIWMLSKRSQRLETIFAFVFLMAIVKHFTHFLALKIRHGLKISAIKGTLIKDEFQQIKRFSFWNFVSAFSGMMINQFDKTLVGIFLGPSAITIYYGVQQLIKIFTSVVAVINDAVIPYFSNKITQLKHTEFNHIAERGTTISSFIAFAFAAYLVLFHQRIFNLMAKDFLIDYSTIFIVGLMLYAFIAGRNFINKMHIAKADIIKELGIIVLITSGLYPIIFYVLTKKYSLNGAILSPIIAHIIVFPAWLYIVLRTTKMTLSRFFKSILISGVCILIVFLPFYFLNQNWKQPPLLVFSIECLISLILLVLAERYIIRSSIFKLIRNAV